MMVLPIMYEDLRDGWTKVVDVSGIMARIIKAISAHRLVIYVVVSASAYAMVSTCIFVGHMCSADDRADHYLTTKEL